ncbi:hypothetical protein NMG60_11020773 [Bertholletia excelsa]
MEYRPLEITVISADDLKDVNMLTKMDVYVVVSIANDPRTKRRTRVDKDGGKNPRWNDRLSFSVDQSALARQPNLCLVLTIRSERPLGDKDIGEVTIPINELLASNPTDDAPERIVDYQVRTASGKPKGTLRFSYKFREKITAATNHAAVSKGGEEPVTAYPPAYAAASASYAPPPGLAYAPPAGTATAYAKPGGYPPPPPGYGYPPPPPHYGPYPPPAGYAYPPQGYGYPPPPVVQPQAGKKKQGSKFGLGLGAGLLGGLLVGDMISDVGEVAAYDDGYADGFGDAGFDF